MTPSIAALKEAKRKENISQQEQHTIKLTQGRQVSSTSMSVGMAIGGSTVPSTTSTVISTVSSTMETEQEVDLEEIMQSQGDEEDEGYGKKYKTMSEDRTDRGMAHAKQNEEHE